MYPMLYGFLSGAVCLGCWTVADVFVSYWRKTRDRFFLLFALAFVILGVERLMLALLSHTNEFHAPAYVTRLLGFVIILLAIADKNRSRGGPRRAPPERSDHR
jgi:uncharacterized membrane protein